ncbi:MAG TPA: hypothetical protein PLS90_13170 [Candidatus Sumerlaeota bacterium]|nr:hypothetical protein [Candidatus Sumerlaeota bacterium]HOR29311.1 hypothetical protein [Candidatus Sumerlaeota bacterium]HPK03395.1 hypothetical protein [Candidatus Sumerlaeota bacterium]
MDRTVKILLTIIAVLLAILVVRPALRFAPEVTAQTSDRRNAPNPNPEPIIRWHTDLLSTIPHLVNKRKPEIHVINGDSAFLLQYDDRVEVWRIQQRRVVPVSR